MYIKFEDVYFSYNSERRNDPELAALRGVTLEINKSEFVAVIGRNGSGKSTMARLINGLLLPSSGLVTVDGYNTSDEKNLIKIRRQVGMVFQNPDNQIIGTTVEEDAAFGPENLGIPPEKIRILVDESLAKVGMEEYKLSAPHLLSGGQKQRVAIAGTLAMNPACLVLDEATAMLDPIGRRELLSVVLELKQKENITVILITHHMDEACLADRVIVVNDGNIAMDGVPVDIFKDADALKSLGLYVPQHIELFWKLKKAGTPLEINSVDMDALLSQLTSFLRRKP